MRLDDGTEDPEALEECTLAWAFRGPFADELVRLAERVTQRIFNQDRVGYDKRDDLCHEAIVWFLDRPHHVLKPVAWPGMIAKKARHLYTDERRKARRAGDRVDWGCVSDSGESDPRILAEVQEAAARITAVVASYHPEQFDAALVGADVLDLHGRWLAYERDGLWRPHEGLREAVEERCAAGNIELADAANTWPMVAAEIYVELAEARASMAVLEPLAYLIAACKGSNRARRDPGLRAAFWLREWGFSRDEALRHAGVAHDDRNLRALSRFCSNVKGAGETTEVTPEALRELLPRPSAECDPLHEVERIAASVRRYGGDLDTALAERLKQAKRSGAYSTLLHFSGLKRASLLGVGQG